MMRLAIVAALTASAATAHDGVVHKSTDEAAAHRQAAAQEQITPGSSLPFDLNLGGAFTLTDHTGAARTEADPNGHPQLVFFGYANCQSICSVALPLMAQAVDILETSGKTVTPIMITVDPARDRVDSMATPLAAHHERFVGLTGTQAELAIVYDLFSVEHKVVFEDPEYGEVFAHGSHIYLLDAQGNFLTLLPPILSADRVAEVVAGYVGGPDS